MDPINCVRYGGGRGLMLRSGDNDSCGGGGLSKDRTSNCYRDGVLLCRVRECLTGNGERGKEGGRDAELV